MRCPNCMLENPPGALLCDCGYDFPTGTRKESDLTGSEEKLVGIGGLPVEHANRWRRRLLALQYVVTLFSGVVLCDWAISEVFNLPANAIESLTEISLKCAIVVAILGAAFSRRWINPKTTLITTTLLSLGVTIIVLSVYIH
jgi:hypothetical protein